MLYRNKLILLAIVVFLLALLQLALPGHPQMVEFYANNVFRPFQSFRNIAIGYLPFSLGDLFYIYLFIALLYSVCCWIYYLIKLPQSRHQLGHSLIKFLIYVGLLYVWFFIGWGGNYYKPSLSEYWELNAYKTESDSDLVRFNAYLINQLNYLAPKYKDQTFKQINKNAQKYYSTYTENKTKLHGVRAKPGIFGNKMEYVGIQGYYNPFTGEAQVNRHLPAFMIPFVISHEMAHQSGIAAEDDANLLAYALGTSTRDVNFRYSAFFNIWLYTHSRLRHIDTNLAAGYKQTMNTITLAHIENLKEYRSRYMSDISEYSAVVYDGYLRLHSQKDGIKSYNNVAISAWQWEKKKSQPANKLQLIQIP